MTAIAKFLWAICIYLVATMAEAANCTSYPYPYTLTNGTAVSATQIMDNFSEILSCANSSTLLGPGGTLTGGTLAGTTTNNGPIAGGASDFSTAFIGGTGPIGGGYIFETQQTNSGADVRGDINNDNTESSSTATLELETGVTNAYLLQQIDTNTGAPGFSLSTGNGITGGITIDASAATGAPLTLKANTAITYQSSYADQSYSKQVPTTGFSITVGNTQGVLILTPAGTLASGTIILPGAPVDGQIVRITTTQAITSLALQANSGQTIMNAPTSFSAGAQIAYIYVASVSKWYRMYG